MTHANRFAGEAAGAEGVLRGKYFARLHRPYRMYYGRDWSNLAWDGFGYALLNWTNLGWDYRPLSAMTC